ncbi:hypothetical protein, partial [Acidovorax sp. SD340]|uniref:hypothetical protein n=1 Tax=Acidovorax sp. SD340 TaxID=1690268 RepID=UPI001A95A3E5
TYGEDHWYSKNDFILKLLSYILFFFFFFLHSFGLPALHPDHPLSPHPPHADLALGGLAVQGWAGD